MERIRLSKTEKRIMRMLAAGMKDVPSDMPYDKYVLAANSLKAKNMVRCTILSNGKVWDISLTKAGKLYMYENPALANPVSWKAVSAITAILAFIVSIIALFVSCME